MPSNHERMQEKLQQLSLRRAQNQLKTICEECEGIKSGEFVAQVAGLTPGAHEAPFVPMPANPENKIFASLDISVHENWMSSRLQQLGEGDSFFLAAPNVCPGWWLEISSAKGTPGLLQLAVKLGIQNRLSLFNPSSGNSICFLSEEYETLCFFRVLSPDINQ